MMNWVATAARSNPMTRVMGLLLAAVATQFIVTGVQEAFNLK